MDNSELQSVISANQAIAADIVSKSNEYAARVTAVDVTLPDAGAQVAAIVSERDTWKATANASLQAGAASARAITASFPVGEEQDAARALNVAAIKEINVSITDAAAAFATAKDSKNADITAAKPESSVKTPSSTNPDTTAAEAADKQASGTVVGDSTPGTDVGLATAARNSRLAHKGGMPTVPKAASVTIKNSKGQSAIADLRVQIRVPDQYLVPSTNGLEGELEKLKAIIFPYTPAISFEHKADYSAQTPTHSNFTQYFYKSSSVSDISISGKFTVQNEKDAGVYLATVHLLRALTKMLSGGSSGDPMSGSPPPVCRLDAYGVYMLDNVPVVIRSFKMELPDGVDYFTIGKNPKTSTTMGTIYGQASVPTVSTLSITCSPIYSRDEMQKFSVNKWLAPQSNRRLGIL